MRRTVALLHAMPTPLPPPDLAEAVMQRVRRGEGRRRRLPDLGISFPGFSPTAIAVPATAVLAVALVVTAVGTPELPFRVSTLWTTDAELRAGEAATPRAPVAPSPRRAAPAPAPLHVGEATRLQPVPLAAGRSPLATESIRLIPVFSGAPEGFRAGVAQSAAVSGADFSPSSERSVTPALDDPIAKALRRRYELDRRLDFLLLSPESFASDFRTQSLAAQELWMAELVERAVERNITDEVLETLRSSRGRDGQKLAQLFATSVGHLGPPVRAERD